MIKRTLIRITVLLALAVISYHGCTIYDKFNQQQVEIAELKQTLSDTNVKLAAVQSSNYDQIELSKAHAALTSDLIIKLQEQQQLVDDYVLGTIEKK